MRWALLHAAWERLRSELSTAAGEKGFPGALPCWETPEPSHSLCPELHFDKTADPTPGDTDTPVGSLP